MTFDENHQSTANFHGTDPVDSYSGHQKVAACPTYDTMEEAHENESMEIDDGTGKPVHYLGEDADETHGSKPVTRRDNNIDTTITVLKYIYSMALLVFSVTIVMSAIFTEQTEFSQQVNPILAFFLIWFLVLWLAMMEGGQGCLIGLQPVDKALYEGTHPVTLLNAKLAHKGDNMERFIVGRQFLNVLVVFAINQCGGAIAGASVLDLPDVFTELFLTSGIAMIMMTLVLGQLTAQVNATNCMLDFINNYFMLFTTYVSLAIEMSGLLHSVYLVQIFFSTTTGNLKSNEPPRSAVAKLLFWARVVMSLGLLVFSFAVTLTALFNGQTTIYGNIPSTVSVVIFFVLMAFVGMMEGMQIALFAVMNLPSDELKKHKIAAANCELAFSGSNLSAFLIGRQICVTCCMFVVAKITTLDVDTAAGDPTIFGVSSGAQAFFNTGLLGALITTIVGSLAWRIVASSFPVAFLSNPLIYLILRLNLILEKSGLCAAAWLLARIHKAVVGYQPDEVYIGTKEERAAAKKTRDDLQLEEVDA